MSRVRVTGTRREGGGEGEGRRREGGGEGEGLAALVHVQYESALLAMLECAGE